MQSNSVEESALPDPDVVLKFLQFSTHQHRELFITPEKIAYLQPPLGEATLRVRNTADLPILVLWKHCQPLQLIWRDAPTPSIHIQYRDCLTHKGPRILIFDSNMLVKDISKLFRENPTFSFPSATNEDKMKLLALRIPGMHRLTSESASPWNINVTSIKLATNPASRTRIVSMNKSKILRVSAFGEASIQDSTSGQPSAQGDGSAAPKPGSAAPANDPPNSSSENTNSWNKRCVLEAGFNYYHCSL